MKTIIEMAREAAGLAGPALVENIEITEWLERFATEVKAAHTAELVAGVEMPEAHQLFTERCGHFVVTADQMRETVAAAVLREREACAKVCEDMWGDDGDADDFSGAIRNRSKA